MSPLEKKYLLFEKFLTYNHHSRKIYLQLDTTSKNATFNQTWKLNLNSEKHSKFESLQDARNMQNAERLKFETQI